MFIFRMIYCTKYIVGSFNFCLHKFAMNTWGVELNDRDTKATVSRLLLSDRKWCPVLIIILMYSYIYHQ